MHFLHLHQGNKLNRRYHASWLSSLILIALYHLKGLVYSFGFVQETSEVIKGPNRELSSSIDRSIRRFRTLGAILAVSDTKKVQGMKIQGIGI